MKRIFLGFSQVYFMFLLFVPDVFGHNLVANKLLVGVSESYSLTATINRPPPEGRGVVKVYDECNIVERKSSSVWAWKGSGNPDPNWKKVNLVIPTEIRIDSGGTASRAFTSAEGGDFYYRIYCRGTKVTFPPDTVPLNLNFEFVDQLVKVTVIPSAPASLTYTSSDADGAFGVNWAASAGTNLYELERRQGNGPYSQIYRGTVTSFNQTGLGDGTYNYRVRGCFDHICSGYTTGPAMTVEHAPPAPASITVPASVSGSTATISWAASQRASSYKLEQQENNGPWSVVIDTPNTSQAISNLNHESTYHFRVSACNSTCSAALTSGPMEVVFTPGTPALTVSPATSLDGNYTLDWNVKPFAASYDVHNAADVLQHSGTATSFAFTNVANGTYRYKVRACNRLGVCSAFSALSEVTVDRAVGVPIASVSPATSHDGVVTVSWTEVVKGALTVHYDLADSTNTVIHSTTTRSHTITGLANGQHCYKVRARTTGDTSAYSPEACVMVSLLSPPVTPNPVTAPASTPEAYTVSWPAVSGATKYQLDQRINNGVWTTVSSGAATSYTYPATPAEYGTHRYRVRAGNAAGWSAFSAETVVIMEVDPTEKIREQLYYNEAEEIPATEENAALGLFSRDLAAFRYLDLMYVIDPGNGQVFNRFASGDALVDFATLYGGFERARALGVEDFINEQLAIAGNAGNTNLQRFMLDVYYDRVVAEMTLANEALDNARISRLRNESLLVEQGHIEQAHSLLQAALDQYDGLLTFTPEFLQTFAASRGQISPRYRDANDVAQNVMDATRLFTGYKDIVMLYQLMTKTATTKMAQARLLLVAGQTNQTLIDTMLNELGALKTALANRETSVKGLFPTVDFKAVTGLSGLPEAVHQFETALHELDLASGWLVGDNNILGIPNDAVLMIHDYKVGGTTVHDSFDAMELILNPGDIASPLAVAVASQQAAELSYNNYRHNRDRLATEAVDRNRFLNNQVFALLGVQHPPNCFSPDCSIGDSAASEGSEIALQRNNINSANIALERNLTRMENLLAAIEVEIDRRGQEAGVVDARSKVVLKYGDLQVKITEQITKIRVRAARAKKKGGLIKGITNIVADVVTLDPVGAIASVGPTIGEAIIRNAEIKQLKRVGALQAASQRLAAEERAELIGLDSRLLDITSQAKIRTLWLEANTIALDIAQAELTVEHEIERMIGMLNNVQRLVRQVYETNTALVDRFFADPIHGTRLTKAMLKAERDFDYAHKQLFFAANALEYKWQEGFLGPVSGITKQTVFKLRLGSDLAEFYNELVAFDNSRSLSGMQRSKDTFSIKKDAFGYVDQIGGVIQQYPHPDPAQAGGPLLSADDAFSAHLKFLTRRFGTETWVTINFSSVKELARSNFFVGPILGNADDMTCLADGGNYLDKIDSVQLNISVLRNPSGEASTSAFLTYGGTSYLRDKTPGTLTADGLGIKDELVTHSPRFWVYSNNNQLVYNDNIRTNFSAALNTGNGPPTTPVTTVFKERSVATTGWRLSFKLADRFGEIVNTDFINDVEVIFDHHYRSRNFTACSGGGGPLSTPVNKASANSIQR